jgi:putative acetyltransferase
LAWTASLFSSRREGRAMTEFTSASPDDSAAILAVHRTAFSSGEEAALVDALHSSGAVPGGLSVVARRGDAVVGHALCSALGVDGEWAALVLAPVAVAPPAQGEGVGSALVREALSRAADAGWDAVFLHGSPAFYERFGFRPACELGFENPFDTPPAEFMVATLSARAPPGGALDYPAAFDVLS